MLSDEERERVRYWWELAAERFAAGPRETSWLSATLMVQMALGYAADSVSRVPPIAYSLATRTGYALRMYVSHLEAPRPLDVSKIDADSIALLATFPVDEEIGTVDVPDEIADQFLLPLVVLVSATANQGNLFADVVSVEPQLWNACVEVSVAEIHDDLIRRGIIRRAKDLSGDVIENFLRFGYVLRCLDKRSRSTHKASSLPSKPPGRYPNRTIRVVAEGRMRPELPARVDSSQPERKKRSWRGDKSSRRNESTAPRSSTASGGYERRAKLVWSPALVLGQR